MLLVRLTGEVIICLTLTFYKLPKSGSGYGGIVTGNNKLILRHPIRGFA